MTLPRIGIALCTYNGARYLREQLDSIAAQTVRPDSLVLVDDGSTDDTAAIARAFAREAPFAMQVVINPLRLGFVRNFEKAIGLARGDVIALADQDDVWMPGKLERMAGEFAHAGTVGMVFTDAELVDAGLRRLGVRLWDTVQFTAGDRRRMAGSGLFERALRRNPVTGATLAFRADLRPLLLPLTTSGPHDGWIALLASAVSDVVAVDEPLVLYRQHGANQIGARVEGVLYRVRRVRTRGHEDLASKRAMFREAVERLERHGAPAGRVETLRDAVAHLDRRLTLRGSRLLRLAPICRELLHGGYRRRSNGVRTAVRDLLS